MKLKTAHRRVVDPKLNRSIITSNDPRLIHTGNRKHTQAHQQQTASTPKQQNKAKTPATNPSTPPLKPKTAENSKKQQTTTKNHQFHARNKDPPTSFACHQHR
jgi:hypothetical protein